MNYDIKNNNQFVGLQIWIQCTWVRVFTEPIIDKGLCIRSYDRNFVSHAAKMNFNNSNLMAMVDPYYKKFVGLINDIKRMQIGELTGNYCTDAKGVVWLQARILYCDRRIMGWFREKDVWHPLKATKQNPLDGLSDNDTNNTTNPEGSNTWIAWLTAGLSLLSIFR